MAFVISPLVLRCAVESWKMARPFRITGYTFDVIKVVLVTLSNGRHIGRGEAAGVYYKGETAASIARQIESFRPRIEVGISRDSLRDLLPAGGARSAIDCALWDLEAKCSNCSVWDLAGSRPRAVQTCLTIGIEPTPQEMADQAAAAANYRLLKVKVDADRPVERVAAIRAVRPDATLFVDANQAWNLDQLAEVAPALARLDVKLIEQPLPRGGDSGLEGYQSPLPLSADESCQGRGELDDIARRYQVLNIKLDKAGGLTEALSLAQVAQARGLQLLTGSMCGTSLAMAPGFVLAQRCSHVELDGHLLLDQDRAHGLSGRNGHIDVPDPRLWG